MYSIQPLCEEKTELRTKATPAYRLHNGYVTAATTDFGIVVALKTEAVNIGLLTFEDPDQNYLISENRHTQIWWVEWVLESRHKMEILRNILPSLVLTHIPNLMDSELYAATVTKAGD